MKLSIFLILPLILFSYGLQSIPEVEGTRACSASPNLNEFIMITAEPRVCERVNYWVHPDCGRIEGLHLTDSRCQPPAGFPLERLAKSGSFMDVNLDKTIYKMDDTIHVTGNVYTSVGIPKDNLGITVIDSNGNEIFKRAMDFNHLGKFSFDILTGTTISINEEDNYELKIVHYGKYGSMAVEKFTVSNDGLPIPIQNDIPEPISVSPPDVTNAPQPIVVQVSEPNSSGINWTMIAGFIIVGIIIAVLILKKIRSFTGTDYDSGFDRTHAEENYDEDYNDSNDPMYPTREDLENNFERFSEYEMEELTGKLFRAKGYSVKVSPKSGDQKIDVWATTEDGTVIGIQVKHWKDNVGHDTVSEVLGSNLGKVTQYIIISTKKGFTKSAYEHEEQHKLIMNLWDSDKFKEEITLYLIEQDNSKFEEEQKPDSTLNYYEVLGVLKNATQEEIKNRYREVSLKFHPDKEKSSLSETMMRQVNAAYETLKDVEKRKQYDSELESA